MPDQTTQPAINLNISDPASADIQAVCGAVTAVCTFLCTPQGQALLEKSQKDAASFEAWVAKGWSGFTGLFRAKAAV